MQVKKTQDTPTSLTLTITANEADLTPIKNAAVKKLGQNVKVAGFRPGKAPQAVIEKNIDPAALQTEVMEDTINHYYAEAIRNEKLRPVAHPTVSIKKFVPFTLLEAELTVSVVGDIVLPDYKKIKLAPTPVTVTAADITDVLKSLQERAADKQPVERAAKNGDEATIDFKGTDTKGQAIKGADGKDYPLILGSNAFIPGFEDNVIGLKAGDEKTFKLTFPKDYGVAALAGKVVNFAITVKKVQALAEPKLDDEFASKVGPFKDMKELKTDIKKQLTAEREQTSQRDYQNQLLEKITAKSKLAVPESLTEDQLESMEREERQNLMYKGTTWEEHLKEEGVTEKEHRERNREKAELRVKAGLVLSEISEKEKIQVTPEELEVRIQLLKGQYQDAAMQSELDKPENRQDIAMRILSEKTIDRLTGYATKK
ncbi:MAG: trigger factor [Candidatus Saccharimonadales bacterium]